MSNDTVDTTDMTAGSIGSLLNPIYAITGGPKQWKPQAVTDLGRKIFHNMDQKRADQMSSLMWKTGVGATVAASALILARALTHTAQLGQYAVSPGNSIQNTEYNSMRSPYIQKEASVILPDGLLNNPIEQASFWVPPAAMLLAGAMGYAIADKVADMHLGSKLEDKLQQNQRQIHKAIIARAALARGNRNKYTRDVQQQLTKSAGLVDKVSGSMTLLLAALGIGSAYAGYRYFAGRDEDRARYDAAKDALKHFTAQRMLQDTIDRRPISNDVVSAIEGDGPKAKPVREQPQLQPLYGEQVEVQY